MGPRRRYSIRCQQQRIIIYYYCHCMIVRFALIRFVCFDLCRFSFVSFARRFSALGGGAKSAAVTSKVPESSCPYKYAWVRLALSTA